MLRGQGVQSIQCEHYIHEWNWHFASPRSAPMSLPALLQHPRRGSASPQRFVSVQKPRTELFKLGGEPQLQTGRVGEGKERYCSLSQLHTHPAVRHTQLMEPSEVQLTWHLFSVKPEKRDNIHVALDVSHTA